MRLRNGTITGDASDIGPISNASTTAAISRIVGERTVSIRSNRGNLQREEGENGEQVNGNIRQSTASNAPRRHTSGATTTRPAGINSNLTNFHLQPGGSNGRALSRLPSRIPVDILAAHGAIIEYDQEAEEDGGEIDPAREVLQPRRGPLVPAPRVVTHQVNPNLFFTCPIRASPEAPPCRYSCPLLAPADRSNALRHLQRHRFFQDEAFCHEITEIYGFVLCPEENCRQVCMGTVGLNRHHAIKHQPGRVNNARGRQEQRPVDEEVHRQMEEEQIDDEARRRAQGKKQPALFSIRGNNPEILSKVSQLLSRILIRLVQVAGEGNQDEIDVVTEAFKRAPSVIQMIQEINKNRKADVYKARMLAFLDPALAKPLDELAAFVISEYRDRYLDTYINLMNYRATRRQTGSRKQRMAQRVVQLCKHGRLASSLNLAEKVAQMGDDEEIQRASRTGEEARIYVEGKGLFPDVIEELQGEILVPNFTVTVEEVANAMRHLRRESSPGMSGLTNELLRTLADPYFNDQADALVGAITGVFNLMIKNAIGEPEAWTVARLVLIDKLVADDLRPLGIGDSLPRLFGRVVVAKKKEAILVALKNYQYGVCKKAGGEIVAQACRIAARIIDEEDSSGQGERYDSLSLLAIDITNAYGSMSRKQMELGVLKYMPDLHAIFRFLYGSASVVYHDDGTEIARVRTGVRQGDPLGALFFCLGLQLVFEEVHEMHPNVMMMAYIDDAYSLAKHNENGAAVSMLIRLMQERCGMSINDRKSASYVSRLQEPEPGEQAVVEYHRIDDNLQFPKQNCMKCMGVYVGEIDKVRAAIETKIENAALPLSWIHQLPPDTAYALLRYCVEARLMFLARSLPPDVIGVALGLFDRQVDESLCRIAKIGSLSRIGGVVRGLPVTFQGLALPRLADINRRAFFSSLLTMVEYFQNQGGWFLAMTDKVGGVDGTKWVISESERMELRSILPSYFRQEDDVAEGGHADATPVHTPAEIPRTVEGVNIKSRIRVPILPDTHALDTAHRQRALVKADNIRRHEELLRGCALARDRLAVAYLKATPLTAAFGSALLSGTTTTIYYQLTDLEFIEMLQRKLWAGLEVAKGDRARCPCGKSFNNLTNPDPTISSRAGEALAMHAGMCVQSSGDIRIQRHDAAKRALAQTISRISPNNRVEVEHQVGELRADVFARNVSDPSATAYVDLSVVSAVYSDTLEAVEGDINAATKAREVEKVRVVNQADVHANYKRYFVPFVWTDTGRLGDKAKEYLDKLTKWNVIPRVFDAKIAGARRHFIKSIGVITDRYNARLRIHLRNRLTWD